MSQVGTKASIQDLIREAAGPAPLDNIKSMLCRAARNLGVPRGALRHAWYGKYSDDHQFIRNIQLKLENDRLRRRIAEQRLDNQKLEGRVLNELGELRVRIAALEGKPSAVSQA